MFLPGHVGFMVDQSHILHANAHHMAVTIDPLDEVEKRVRRDHLQAITARKRFM